MSDMATTPARPGLGTGVGASIRAVGSRFRRHPEVARITDSPATAVLEDGLRCHVSGPHGWDLATDMHPTFGGGGTAPLPSWLLRAAMSSCIASTIAMRAAELDVELTELRVEVDSDTDLRGMLGLGTASAAPLQVRVRVSIDGDASRECLEELAAWGPPHSPVAAAVEQAVEVTVTG